MLSWILIFNFHFSAQQSVWGSKGASGPQGKGGGKDEKEVLPRGASEDQLSHEEDKQGGSKQPSTCFTTCFTTCSAPASSLPSSSPWASCSSNSSSFACSHSHTCSPRLSSPSEGGAPGDILSNCELENENNIPGSNTEEDQKLQQVSEESSKLQANSS